MENIIQITKDYPAVLILLKAVGVLFLAYISYVLSKKYLVKFVTVISSKSRNRWDDILAERKVFNRLANAVPVAIIHVFAYTFPPWEGIISRVSLALILLMLVLFLDALLNALVQIYNTYEVSKHKPIKNYVQTIKIIIYCLGGVVIVATGIGRSPTLLLSGIGAMTAVLMLVFKDTILSLVAGMQLSYDGMIRIGDWITMPKYDADGDVVDIALHTIKIQNFDKTITTIPTYKFISESFTNWRGMVDSGGRRIKRAVNIDMSSIKFLDVDLKEKLKKADLLKDYIEQKDIEITKYHIEKKVDKEDKISQRRLTNIGTFRKYLYYYLKNNLKIHQGMTLLVRQLSPTAEGLPIQIYAFTNDNRWANYEEIQADIFDHILAVAPKFDLKVYQHPTGFDFKKLAV